MSVSVTPYRGVVRAGSGAVTQVTASASTSWSELIASTASAIYVVAILPGYQTLGATPTVDIGTGAAASEVSVAQAFSSSISFGVGTIVPLRIPVRISAGVRVSVKAGSGTSGSVGILYVSEGQVS